MAGIHHRSAVHATSNASCCTVPANSIHSRDVQHCGAFLSENIRGILLSTAKGMRCQILLHHLVNTMLCDGMCKLPTLSLCMSNLKVRS